MLEVDGNNTEAASFDAVMDLLVNAGDDVSIILNRPVKKAPAPKGSIDLTVKSKEGDKTKVIALGSPVCSSNRQALAPHKYLEPSN